MNVAKQISPYARLFAEGLKEAEASIVGALPDSLLASIHWLLSEDPYFKYVPVSNEAELPGIVAGAYMGGKRSVMIMENSGLRQACEPIARFALSHHMPMVMVMPFRGDLGEYNWWGHSHAQTMIPLLDALRIPYRILRTLDEIKPAVKRSFIHTDSSQWPFALIMAGECVEVPHYAKD